MAHSKSALKRWRQNDRRRERNKSVRSTSRTAVKNARAPIDSGNSEEAEAAVRGAIGVLDKASKSNVVHRNAVARHKSRLMRRLNAIGSPTTAAPRKGTKTTAKKTTAKPRAKKAAAKK